MSVVVLVFLALVLYWALKQRSQARTIAAADEFSALPVIETPAVSRRPAERTMMPSSPEVEPAEMARTVTHPMPTTQPVADQTRLVAPFSAETAPVRSAGRPMELSRADHHMILSLPVLAHVSTDERESLVAAMRCREYRAGEDVFEEHEDAASMCLLVSGRIGLLTEVAHGRRIAVGTVRPGELFAWSGVCGGHHFTATAHVMEDSVVAILSAEKLRALCESAPHLGYHLMEKMADTIAERVRDRDTQLSGLLG
jgi:CRP-like cAMP-binding protein